ncbi:MAG: tRNA pseudouridine(55) synthase TruB [Pyrinomonadaceae bacterium]|nr:tRNA pseudouridine(55) synthase TruB [Pyrinomonadaceae bacterium]
MDGILIIDKPAGITSHDVVYRVRRILKTKRVGHTGTLDPFATGVMVVLVGRATRLAQFLDKDEKEYEAVVRFGFETDTGDRTGEPNAESQMSEDVIAEKLAATDWETVLEQFRGSIEQTPPMYSAKKVAGKKLYELARKGEMVERKAAAVSISKLEIKTPVGPTGDGASTWDLGLVVRCSAGTYIRTLAEDIGRRTGVGAHLAELRRTAAGMFTIDHCTTLDRFADNPEPALELLPMNEAVSHLPAITLREDRVAKTRNGMSTRVFETGLADREVVRMIDEAGDLLAIGFFDAAENVVQPKVVLV